MKEKFVREFEKRSTSLIETLETMMEVMDSESDRIAELETELQDANARIAELEDELAAHEEIEAATSNPDSDEVKAILTDLIFDLESALAEAKTSIEAIQ